MVANKLRIGMFGYGCVGQGLHDVLNNSKGFRSDIVKICVKDQEKERPINISNFTFNKDDILNDPSINLVVELIDDADDALEIVTRALKSGKSVVTANKKMVANNLGSLVELQEKHNVSLLYEASSCASIPIIRNLEEYYDNELLFSLRGIFNGSTNYILSQMYDHNLEFDDVLKDAQEQGFVETDASLDIDGFDAKFKLCIITTHAYGLIQEPDEVFNYGIGNINSFDIRFAKEKGFKIKLVPYVGKIDDNTITSYVLPQFISNDRYLFGVDNEFNGVVAEAAFADKQFFYGKGAGGHATGSAVLSDISANSYGYRYEYKKRNQQTITAYSRDVELEIYFRYKNETDLAKLELSSISETYKGKEYRYVIGKINLQKLYDLRNEIKDIDGFIVRI